MSVDNVVVKLQRYLLGKSLYTEGETEVGSSGGFPVVIIDVKI